MQTAMSRALVNAGLITEERAEKAVCIPRHLCSFQTQIEEISRLAELLKSNGVKMSGEDKIAYLVYASALSRGLYAQAFDDMLEHLKKKIAILGLAS